MKTTGWREFKSDLKASLRVWSVAPMLPLSSVVIFQAFTVPEPWFWFVLPVALFSVGWFGTERIWYLRVYREQSINPKALWRLTWAFFWRFARLGLLVMIVWSPVFGLALFRASQDSVALFRASQDSGDAGAAWERADVQIALAIVVLVLDFTLTFATQALAFSRRRVREALRVGITMLRREWPRSALFAFVPSVTWVVSLRVFPAQPLNLSGQMLWGAGVTLLLLWFKGATAAFYLRRVEVGDQGSAFSERGETAPQWSRDHHT